MDPITLVMAAVVAGASAGLKDTVSESIKDAYRALKELLVQRRIDLSGVERKPSSESKQTSLREDLQDLAGPEDKLDETTVNAARHLLAMVKANDPEAARAVGIDLEHLDVGGSLSIKGVTAAGSGLRGKDWKTTGDVVIENIDAGRTEGAEHPS